MGAEKFYPAVENLGKECRYWQGVDIDAKKQIGARAVGCFFPKYEMQGRLSCEGIIDDMCLFMKIGRKPKSLTDEQIAEIRQRMPYLDTRSLPPGDIT